MSFKIPRKATTQERGSSRNEATQKSPGSTNVDDDVRIVPTIPEPSTPPTSVPTLGRGRMPILRLPITKAKRKIEAISEATATAAATETVQARPPVRRALFGNSGNSQETTFGGTFGGATRTFAFVSPRSAAVPTQNPVFSFGAQRPAVPIQAGTTTTASSQAREGRVFTDQQDQPEEPLHLKVQRLEMRLDVVTKLLNVTMAQQLHDMQNMQLLQQRLLSGSSSTDSTATNL